MMLVCVVNVMHLIHYLIMPLRNWLLLKKSLVTFVNKHLNKLNFDVHDLGTDFKDGVYLCLLTGILGNFFVPLYDFHLTPKDTDQMVRFFYFFAKIIYFLFVCVNLLLFALTQVHNVAFSFELMQDVGLPKPKARPEGIYFQHFYSTWFAIIDSFFFFICRYCQHGS